MTELLEVVSAGSRDAARYVAGAATADEVAFDSHAAVVARALRSAFRTDEELRAVAALARGDDPTDVTDVSPETAARYRDRYADRVGDEECEPTVLAALDVPDDTARRACAIVQSGIAGADTEARLLGYVVKRYFARHDEIRNAAVAARYAEGGMSTGRASDLAGVQKGGEIESLLREHGVEPRVGPSADPEARRAEREAARRAFGAGDADDEADGLETNDDRSGTDDEHSSDTNDETSDTDRG